MEIKPRTPILIFLRMGVSKSTFDNLSDYFGLNSDIFYSLPRSKMNVVWGRIDKNKVIIGTYHDNDSLSYVINNIISKVYSDYFHILIVSHEKIIFENQTLNIFDQNKKDFDLISLQNKNFSKL